MFTFEADSEDEARRFIVAWIERHPVKATARVTLAKLGDTSPKVEEFAPRSDQPTIDCYVKQQARSFATTARE